ncbi:hypothetical protein [Mycolicibacterium vinylchloridicum]|uniref:hypothetical protein n=1 Tax=Mycolicibacterium vinylchloridicum TaxID=2736928 RepID=UPI0015CE0BAB|nr:hypothetical protein [Mycolicibacterium vinylchloridicum]
MLTTSSGVGIAGTAAALGNVTRAAADVGFDDFGAAFGVERTVGRCWPVDLVLLLDVLGPFAPSEPPASADAVAGIEASAAPMPMATADAPSQPPNSTGSALIRVIVGMAKEFISAPGVDVRMCPDSVPLLETGPVEQRTQRSTVVANTSRN